MFSHFFYKAFLLFLVFYSSSCFLFIRPEKSFLLAQLAQVRANKQYWEGYWKEDTVRIFICPNNNYPLAFGTMQMPNKEIWIFNDNIISINIINKKNQSIGIFSFFASDSLCWHIEEEENIQNLFREPLSQPLIDIKIWFSPVLYDSNNIYVSKEEKRILKRLEKIIKKGS